MTSDTPARIRDVRTGASNVEETLPLADIAEAGNRDTRPSTPVPYTGSVPNQKDGPKFRASAGVAYINKEMPPAVAGQFVRQDGRVPEHR